MPLLALRMTRVILIGAVAVVAFDIVASWSLRLLDASLLFMFLGEGLIYLAAGFAGGRIGGLAGGARAGASVAALDCVVGWPLTWALGTGQVSRLTLAGAAFVLVVMIATGVVAGTVGAVGARALPRR